MKPLTYDEAMELFKLATERWVNLKESDVLVNIGRFGPYIAHDKSSILWVKNLILMR